MLSFEELKIFMESKMRMSHIYQPLLIKCLLEAGGIATIRQLAINFVQQDESQILYYEKKLKEMPIKVLSKHGVISRDGDLIKLTAQKLTFEQRAELKKICEQKLQEYVTKRGLATWDYRLLDADPVPDSLRFRVLRDGKGRCALCGATKNERPLDVDHIIPRSRGGKTVYENLQVLCMKCNRSKRNKDQTDFRKNISKNAKEGCIFCEKLKQGQILFENNFAFALPDGYPVTKGHTLVLPKRHVKDYFDMTQEEENACNDLLRVLNKQYLSKNPLVEGFNLGVNCGEIAGQTIFHCHIHFIPRRKGDTLDPKGGIRNVFPEKKNY